VTERIVQANGAELCVETFGDPADPALLLIAGNGGSMLAWEDEFCARLAAASRFVVRYDQRDTGRSVTYEPGEPRYSGADLVTDAAGVIEAVGADGAHVVGISAGGGIAQLLALDHPERVRSLTLISTSPASGSDLPGMSEEMLAHFTNGPAPPDWSDRDAVIEYVVEDARAYASRSRPFDEAAWRELAGRDFDRSANIESSLTNHALAEGDGPWRGRLGEIRVPTLVIHGSEDPFFQIGHALALVREVPGAELVVLPRAGHELARADWDVVVPAIVHHTADRAG
jgi:pimeloyl-ACP methyl ester carboxylesterase